jgi:signal transduction histidine kinase
MSVSIEEENRHLRAELEQARAELERVQRVNRNFLRIVSHELSSPLTIIMGYVLLWQEKGALGEADELKLIADQARELKRRFATILTLTKLEAGLMSFEPRELPLEQIFERVLSNHWVALTEKHIGLDVSLEVVSETVLADREKIHTVFDELISNAIKFSPPSGTIRVTARREGAECLITIADEGMGIPPEEQARIFEPFYQGDSALTRKRNGLGLGLTLVKALVEMQGGRIGVTSVPGRGSEFCVALPVPAARDRVSESGRSGASPMPLTARPFVEASSQRANPAAARLIL